MVPGVGVAVLVALALFATTVLGSEGYSHAVIEVQFIFFFSSLAFLKYILEKLFWLQSCRGCQLNRLPDVKSFIFEDVPL